MPLQNAVVGLLAKHHYRMYRRIGQLSVSEWTFDDSEHSVRDRWTPLYAHRHGFKEIISWFRRLGMDYRLVDPTVYEDNVGLSLIGVGIEGVLPGHASLDDDEGRGRTALLLASERASTRRLVDVAAALAEGGWDVGVAVPDDLSSEIDTPPGVRTSVLSSGPPISELATPGALVFLRGTEWDPLAPDHSRLLGHALAHPAHVVTAFDLPSLPSAAMAASVHGSHLIYDVAESHAERIQFRDDGRVAFLMGLEHALAPLVDLATVSSPSLVDVFAIRCDADRPVLVLDTAETPLPVEETDSPGKPIRVLALAADDDAADLQLACDVQAALLGDVEVVVALDDASIASLLASKPGFHAALLVDTNASLNRYWSLPQRLIDVVASGLPVVVSGGGGAADFVVRNDIGASVKPSAVELAERITTLDRSQLAAWRASVRALASCLAPNQVIAVQALYDGLSEKPPRSFDAEATAATRGRGASFKAHNAALLGRAAGLSGVPAIDLTLEIARRSARRARSRGSSDSPPGSLIVP